MPSFTIPNRFESLQKAVAGGSVRPLIVPVEADLHALLRLRDKARVQNGGLLCFLLGPSGIGKTTTVHSAAVNMPEEFAPIVSVPVPEHMPLRDALEWITKNVPAPDGKRCLLILFDGRELSDDV